MSHQSSLYLGTLLYRLTRELYMCIEIQKEVIRTWLCCMYADDGERDAVFKKLRSQQGNRVCYRGI